MQTLHVIGTSADTGLSSEAISALREGDLIIGSSHQFDAVEQYFTDIQAERVDYPTPLAKLQALLDDNAHKKVVILASGDPLFFGIGAWLGRHYAPEQLQFYPNTSSIQSAFARVGKSWQHAEVISLHGRPLSSLRSRLHNNRLYALLTDSENTPQAIAMELLAHGYLESKIWVCEDLGGSHERIQSFNVNQLSSQSLVFHPLNVVIVETAGITTVLPEFPGIEDDFFNTDGEPGQGMLSKREVRLNILSLLQPTAGHVCWDVGAGCGGVSVEWARWNPLGTIYSIEYHADRLTCLNANREKYGITQNSTVVEGHAPEAFIDLPDPDRIFIGGSSGPYEITLQQCWSRLQSGGRMVCAGVTEVTKMKLLQFADEIAGEKPTVSWVEIAVSKGDSLGGRLLMRPQLPVLLVSFDKSYAAS